MPRWLTRTAMSIALLLMLTACSRIGLAYRNLDLIIPGPSTITWTSEASKRLVQRTPQGPPDLALHHPIARLPRLAGSPQDHGANRPGDRRSPATAYPGSRGRHRPNRTGNHPSAIELLQGLNDDQVDDMDAAFVKDQRKRQQQYLKPTLQEQIQERSERMVKRLDDWLGPLNDAQRQRVMAWSTALGDQNQQWIANRAHWQNQFSEAVAQRHSPDFPKRIEQLLVNRESLWTPAYREAFSKTEAQARSLLVDLMAESTPPQRERLLKKIDGVKKDFTDLKCLKAARS